MEADQNHSQGEKEMLKNTLYSLCIIACLLLSSAVMAYDNNESFGYRYRATFEINDEIGQASVHVYTNTWVYNQNSSRGFYVWLANPHPDLTPTGSFSSVLVPGGCTMLVGKGVLVIERPGVPDKVQPHTYLTILHSVVVYDFAEKAEMKFENTECRK